MKELWLAIPGFPDYEASNFGEVRRCTPGRSTSVGRRCKPTKNTDGYLHVALYLFGKRHVWTVHRIIAVTFLGARPPDKEIGHLDGGKLNNRLDNLAYMSRSVNQRMRSPDSFLRGIQNGNSKLTESQVAWVKQSQLSSRQCAAVLHVSASTIKSIRKGSTWSESPSLSHGLSCPEAYIEASSKAYQDSTEC